MLRITLDQSASRVTLRLEGTIPGPWVQELARVWLGIKTMSTASPSLVDLSDVTFIASEGRRLLGGMLREGADLQGRGLMQFTIDRIRRESSAGDVHPEPIARSEAVRRRDKIDATPA